MDFYSHKANTVTIIVLRISGQRCWQPGYTQYLLGVEGRGEGGGGEWERGQSGELPYFEESSKCTKLGERYV